MTIRLGDLIKQVRSCKTAAEERNVISKEAAALRQAFKEQEGSYRPRNVCKLLFMHMLGYPTHFGQMETLKLIASPGFPEKRIGYLGLMVLLDERQEVLMLVTNSLKNDLNSKNQYTVGLALCALGNIASTEMARDLSPEVERLMQSANPYIRKKAALCATRVLRKLPDMLESFVDKAADLLTDRSHGVILAGVTLMSEICKLEPAAIEIYRQHVPMLCKILRSLLMSGFSADLDIGGITDPFLQVKILRLLKVLGQGNAEASDAMSDVLAQVATNTEVSKNAGNAILYECVQTIMAVESIGGLRVLAVNILGRFLANKDNNIRYVALSILARVVSVDTQAVQRHRVTIVECVKDADISIRRRALELVYALVNESNIRTLTSELLQYLNVCDLEFKPDLTSKICMLVQRFAPDKRWYIDTMIQVLTQAGAYVKDDACRALAIVIMNASQLHGYAVRSMYTALAANVAGAEAPLLMVSTWCIGEYGELLVKPGALLAGEQPVSVTEGGVIQLLDSVMRRPKLSAVCKEYTITAMMKLAVRFPAQAAAIKNTIAQHASSVQLEVQSRSFEFTRLFNHESIRPQVMEHIPALEQSVHDPGLDMASSVASSESGAGAQSASAANDLAQLLALDLDGGAVGGSAAAPHPPSAVDALQDMLGGDLLGSSHAPHAAAPPRDPLSDQFGGGPAPSGPAPSSRAFVAWEKNGVTVEFAPGTPASDPAVTNIVATFTNSTAEAITNFTFQAAVPKFMQLKLDPATGSSLPPRRSGSVTQHLHVNNSMHGQKPLVMRLRISYSKAGEQVAEQGEVSNFPAGF